MGLKQLEYLLSSDVLEWLTLGRVDCAAVYNVTPSAAIDLVPVLDEPLYLVGARRRAKPGLTAKVALEIENVPARLDPVQTSELKAVLALIAVQSSGRQTEFEARPISAPRLATTLWIATLAQRPRSPLIEQSATLLKELLLRERA